MKCARTWDRLSAYLDGDLPEKEREGIAQHLRQCVRGAEEERALKETLTLLRNLPAGQAPPELIEGVRLRIGKEQAKTPLWKKLFLPAHIKIPLEATAVVLVFLLAYGVQKEMTSSKAPPPPASVGSGQPETATGMRENRQKAGAPARPPTEGSDRETRKNEMRRQTAAAMPEEKKPADDFAPRPETSAGPAKTELPSVPARPAAGRDVPPGDPGRAGGIRSRGDAPSSRDHPGRSSGRSRRRISRGTGETGDGSSGGDARTRRSARWPGARHRRLHRAHPRPLNSPAARC